ncbi:hypothetical protein [Lysinibacillus sp. fls2-241-R2A-57]|uniref:hypothetical protein n=1 Tax=Lysinibacillus sp. fls2-241-R2A-57 TaxID=3040292 RepID=UPI0033056AB7
MNDKRIKDALTIWQELSQSPEEYYAYEARLKYILDEEAKLEDAKYFAEKEGVAKGIKQGIEQGIEQGLEQGLEQGIEQGLEQGIERGEKKKQQEIALKMLQKGIDLETIAEFTELTLSEINKLKEQFY